MDVANFPDRKTTPSFKELDGLKLENPQLRKLDNGIPCYSIDEGTQDVLRLDIVFEAGEWHDKQPLVSMVANAMLREGTSKYTSKQLADKFDYFGAYVHNDTSSDNATVSLFCLVKHFEKVIPFFYEIITDALFPQHELDIFLVNAKEKLRVENEKVSFLSKNKFKESIFGTGHPYATVPLASYYDSITCEVLRAFHKSHYCGANATIIISGKVGEEQYGVINKYFGGAHWFGGKAKDPKANAVLESNVSKILVEKSNAVQSSIRIGKPMINRLHPDFKGMMVLNTVLGGYFGSRLMANIREEKGYTYGIHSGMVSLKHSGYFVISTEVGVDVREAAVAEIYKEIERLGTQPIGIEELQKVKNYMSGSLMRNLDGPFEKAERLSTVLPYGLDYEYYREFFNSINKITPKDLIELAKQYLVTNSFVEIVAGK